jgi:hypothetical protein
LGQYQCQGALLPGTRYFGNTKAGVYMTESDAQSVPIHISPTAIQVAAALKTWLPCEVLKKK